MKGILNKVMNWMHVYRLTLWGGVAFMLIGGLVFVWRDKVPAASAGHQKTEAAKTVRTVSTEDSGLFLGETVDRKAFVGRMEEQYHNAQEKSRFLESRVEALDKKFLAISNAQDGINASMQSLTAKVTEAMLRPPLAESLLAQGIPVDSTRYRMEVVNISPVTEAEPAGVYLPAGSFVSGTLLTGVYAPAEQNNPLPVLIRLNEAFYGPNETRIPLQGAFVIGKATGDLNSERAMVQAVTLSVVNADGKEFQHQGNIGYLTDVSGQLGLKGLVVHNTGGQLAASFMSGFLGGGSQALAEGEITSVSSPGGRISRNVTGNAGRYAVFEGLGRSSAQLSQYYADRAKVIVPAVRVDAGTEVYLVILEGVRVHGLKNSSIAGNGYLD